MTESIILLIGLHGFVDAIFTKYNIWELIEVTLTSKYNGKSRLLFQLGHCTFCQRFWINVILTLLISLLCGFYMSNLLLPFLCSGFIYLIKL